MCRQRLLRASLSTASSDPSQCHPVQNSTQQRKLQITDIDKNQRYLGKIKPRMYKILEHALKEDSEPLDVDKMKSVLLEQENYFEKPFANVVLSFAVSRCRSLEELQTFLEVLESRYDLTVSDLTVLLEMYSKFEAEDQVFSTYERMCDLTESVFDRTTLRMLMKVFSRTSQWRKCYEFLDMCIFINPTDVMIEFDCILCGAALAGDFQAFCTTLVKMNNAVNISGIKCEMRSDLPVHMTIFLKSYLYACEEGKKHFTLENLFFLMKKYQFYIGKRTSIILLLTEQLNRSVKWKAEYGTMNHALSLPVCNVCGSPLATKPLTGEEFEMLREAYYQGGVIGSNIYTNTTPKELEDLEQFIASNGPFDVVIDHLNLQFVDGTYNNWRCSKVIEKLKKRELRCLAITKIYGAKDNYVIKELTQSISVFHVNVQSADDIIMIYATFLCGFHCNILSDDKFIDHSSRLGLKMKLAFQRWQACRQINTVDMLDLQFPGSPDMHAQENAHGWHIPMHGTVNNVSNILCVRRKSRELNPDLGRECGTSD